MRGLLMAFLAYDFPGYGDRSPAGRGRARIATTKTTAKTTVTTV